jgi:hypothetical protein
MECPEPSLAMTEKSFVGQKRWHILQSQQKFACQVPKVIQAGLYRGQTLQAVQHLGHQYLIQHLQPGVEWEWASMKL